MKHFIATTTKYVSSRLIIIIVVGAGLLFSLPTLNQVHADTCAATRVVNQFACVTYPNKCLNTDYRCASSGADCRSEQCGPGEGTCTPACSTFGYGTACTTTGSQNVSCSAAPDCKANFQIHQCTDDSSPSGGCWEHTDNLVYGCWINTGSDPGNPGNPVNVGGPPGACGGCDTCGAPEGASGCALLDGVCSKAGYCGHGTSACNASIDGPSTIPLGTASQFHAYGAGTPDSWYTTWEPTWAGTFQPAGSGYQNWRSDSSGPNSTVLYTPTALGLQTLVWNVHPGDWTHSEIACTTTKPIFVYPVCTPACSTGNMCGQVDGCGGTCASTDVGTPPAVTITYPLNNSKITPVSGQVTATWTPGPTLADTYHIELLASGDTCAGLQTVGDFCGQWTGTSYPFTPPFNKNSWDLTVTPINSSCLKYLYGPSTSTHFNLVGTITGTFYLVPAQGTSDPGIGGVCNVPGLSTPTNPGPGATVNVTDINSVVKGGASAITGTTFAVTVDYSNLAKNTVKFTAGSSATPGNFNQLICPSNGVYTGIKSPQTGLTFYFADRILNNPWFQVSNGSIYAGLTDTGNVGIRSYIPSTCHSPGCNPFVLTQPTGGVANSSGLAVTGGNLIDTNKSSGNSFNELEQRASQQVVIGTKTAKKEDYGYFSGLYSMTMDDANSNNDFDGNLGRSPASDATLPPLIQLPRSGKSAYITTKDLTIKQPWVVPATQKVIVFVPGDLVIDDVSNAQTMMSVAPGGFLAFIVKGDIIFKNTVGTSAPYAGNTPNVTGVFIADGNLTIQPVTAPTPEKRFIGAGTFVGWNGVGLLRDIGTSYNDTVSTEYFISRPDFVKNVPLEMTSANSNWQEVN